MLFLCGCSLPTFDNAGTHGVAPASLRRALNTALSWPGPYAADALIGARPLEDGGPVLAQLAIARSILRTNPRIAPIGALQLAGTTLRAALASGLPPEFLAATLMQESAYDPHALSSAGAIGIAQFMPGTASDNGVNPNDPHSAIHGAATLLASYVRAYRGTYADPYSIALAAYNAGPGAVDRYGGIPPYPETQAYVEIIYERWARIAGYE